MTQCSPDTMRQTWEQEGKCSLAPLSVWVSAVSSGLRVEGRLQLNRHPRGALCSLRMLSWAHRLTKLVLRIWLF